MPQPHPSIRQSHHHDTLLRQAHHARDSWVESSTFTRSTVSNPREVRSLRACQWLPSIPHVLEALYGGEEPLRNDPALRDKVAKLMEPHGKEHGWECSPFLPQDCKDWSSDEGNSRDQHCRTQYREFLRKLRGPDCKELLHGMRQFVDAWGHLEDQWIDHNDHHECSSSQEPLKVQRLNPLVTVIQDYLSIVQTMVHSHPCWASDKDELESTKHYLEVLIYSKFHVRIYQLLDHCGVSQLQEQMDERLHILQFLLPQHLELSFFQEESQNWNQQLERPIELLQLMSQQWCPHQMLDCIFQVTNAIQEILSHLTTHPGADDILSTMVLTIVGGKPSHLLSHVGFVETFAMKEQLQGEVGYAWTVFTSAVQFLRKVNLDPDSVMEHESASLNLSTGELREYLKACQEQPQIGNVCRDGPSVQGTQNIPVRSEFTDIHVRPEFVEIPVSPPSHCQISVAEVRAARLRGEHINFAWAKDRESQNHSKSDTHTRVIPQPNDTIVPLHTESTHTLPTDRTHILPTDNTHTQPTDNTHILPTENTHTLLTDNTHTLPTDTTHTQPTDTTHTKPTVNIHVHPIDTTHTLPTDNTHTLPADTTHTLPTDNTHTLPIENTHILPTENTHTLPTDNTHTLPTVNIHTLPTENTHTLPTENTHTLPTNTTSLVHTQKPLPDWLSRSYTYLHVHPNDIRMIDIPQLMNEYRMMANSIEMLLCERSAANS